MLLKLAWRNIWRNRRRSQIVVISIVVGLVAVVIFDALSVGMIRQMLDNQIGAQVSHIQVHKKGFNDNKLLQKVVPDAVAVAQLLIEQPLVTAFSKRVITFGIISSATSSSGVSLVGIEADKEVRVTNISRSLSGGAYLSGGREILIGNALAEKLDVKLGDKLVAMASRLDGSIGSDVFRVVGMFTSSSTTFDKTTVYINIDHAQEMLGLGGHVSEFAMVTTSLDRAASLQKQLKKALAEKPGSYEVLTFRELLPLLVMQVDVYRESIAVFYGIVALAMLFGIVNTMLMSVMERTSEIGVLMAMGMKNRRIFLMVMLEALLLGSLGTLVGCALSVLIYLPLAKTGIDLSAFASGLNALGTGSTIYPMLTSEGMLSALLVVPIATLIGAVYPALKAMRLTPIKAIRHV